MKGTYTMILSCRQPFRVVIGRLGYARIGAGYYLYTGSALGVGAQSLEGRLRRHLQRSKRMRWHVDYLTSNPRCRIKAAVWLMSSQRMECAINRAVSVEFHAKPVLPGAGSSDCECDGHLMEVQAAIEPSRMSEVLVRVYRRFGAPTRRIHSENSLRKLSVGRSC